MAFTEFCCRLGGSNMNGGALASGAEPATTAVYSATNGGWNSATGVYTPISGNPSLTATVGDFASVFLDGATAPVFIARVTAVNSTTVTLSTTVTAGTAPTTAGTGISINVGGAWAGPSGTVGFPFTFLTNAIINSASDTTRVNFKNDKTYSITANITHSNAGPVYWQGYTTTFGDGGKVTLDGGTTGPSYVLLTINATTHALIDWIFQNNGATGSANGVEINNPTQTIRCIFKNMRGAGHGIMFGNNPHVIIECEAYGCNLSNSGGMGGFFAQTPGTYLRCTGHDNIGANSSGFVSQNGNTFVDCIACNNGAFGFNLSNNNASMLINCDSYNNGSHGLAASAACMIWVENSNFVKNGAYGVWAFATNARLAEFYNCGFGVGTQANTSGNFSNFSSSFQVGTVSYASNLTPWVDPANGDFRINLAAAKGGLSTGGRGNFTQTTSSPNPFAGAIGYPDIGAAQHLDSGGTSGPVARFISAQRGTPY